MEPWGLRPGGSFVAEGCFVRKYAHRFAGGRGPEALVGLWPTAWGLRPRLSRSS